MDEDDLDDLDEGEGSGASAKTTFELNDTLYAEAELEETDTVFLWLGVRPPCYHVLNPEPSFGVCRPM